MLKNKKAACAATLCLAMAVPFAALGEDVTKVITCGTLNLRAAASTESDVIGKYGWGTPVTVKSTSGDWAQVSVGSQNGFMYAKYLGNEGAASSSWNAYVNTNTRGLNLRSAPDGDILGSYPRGTKVTVLSSADGWSKVSVDEKTGFMSSAWLTAKKPASGTTSAPQSPLQMTGTAVVNNPKDTQVLFLREKASIESASLGYYRNGKTVTLLAKTGDWYKVKVDGKTGYMMAKYLKVMSPIVTGTATVMNPNGNSFVNFRKAPSLNASILSTVPVGTHVKVLEKTTDWTKAEVNGAIGYISTWFLKF